MQDGWLLQTDPYAQTRFYPTPSLWVALRQSWDRWVTAVPPPQVTAAHPSGRRREWVWWGEGAEKHPRAVVLEGRFRKSLF